ncbi:hypothetical protein ETR_12948 [Erwinia tracheiphila PSU-1]|nr:hypothetical protein ETR_12948 [Erwinia tracheiphila PSU-1]
MPVAIQLSPALFWCIIVFCPEIVILDDEAVVKKTHPKMGEISTATIVGEAYVSRPLWQAFCQTYNGD